MNFSWLSLIGGGFAAAATLAAGISMSGLAAPSEVPATETPVAETIYVEQPIVEVAPFMSGANGSPLPPRIIAILPPDAATDASVTDTGTAYTTPVPGSVSGDPVLPPSYSDDEDDDGDYAGGDDEDDDEDDDGGDDDGGGDDD
jgi:hypothetical protein